MLDELFRKRKRSVIMIVEYEVFFRDEKIGVLLTDGEKRDRFFPEEAIRKCNDMTILPAWKEGKDTGWIYIPIFENMIRDTMRQNPNAKYIARFTNDFVLIKKDRETQNESNQT